MKIIRQSYTVGNNDYYKLHLSIINTILPVKLTEKEIDVLGKFMSLEKSLIEDEYFNSVTRKKVMDELNLKPGGLSNHLKSMIDKGFLSKNKITKKITIKPFLLPEEKTQGYQIKITKK